MPVWHAATKELVANEELVVLGVIQEQHAERAKLYAQWKKFEFPIVQDAVTENGLAVVPVAVLIDEYGIVRNRRARPNQLKSFLKQEHKKPSTDAPRVAKNHNDIAELMTNAKANSSTDAWIATGDAQLKWSKEKTSASDAIISYTIAKASKPTGYISASVDFRLGVAYRARYDSDQRKPGDFDNAVRHWSAALDANPNQYIWRRRIQQYGPRQIKPYPFYDWVDSAIKEIKKRGDTPVKLTVPLSGAEIAKPSRRFTTDHSDIKNPDPNNKLNLDEDGAIKPPRVTVVPAPIKPGQSVRVHIEFETGSGKWNNEAGPMTIWLNTKDEENITKSAFQIANASKANSNERRRVEFEFRTQKEDTDPIKLTGFATFNACIDADGTCKFLRKNFEIMIPFKN